MFDFCVDNRIYVRYNTNRTNVWNNRSIEKGYIMKDITLMNQNELRAYKREIRRKRDRRNRMFRFGFLFAIVFLASFSVYSISNAKGNDADMKYKYYTVFEVHTNDSLWTIAEEYIDYDKYDTVKEYIHEVQSINHLSDEKIVAGSKLIIPYYSNEVL